MSALTFGLELRRSRLVAFWLAVIVLAYGATIAAMYPILEENSKLLEDYLKILPKELMAAFGMSGNLTDPGVFFSTYIGSFLWPVIAAMGAIILATRPVAADVERGWTEITLGTPLTRTRSLAASIVAQAAVLAALALAAPASVLIGGAIVGAGFEVAPFLASAVVFWLFACAIAGVTSLVAALTLSRGAAAGVAAGLLLAMYLVNIVAELQVDLAWLADFGWFKYLTVTELIDTGVVPWTSIGVFGAVALGGWIAALVVFARRDLLA
ncbi:MAG: ABC transporter permease subunit [Chloroflexi bacterium]|nr:ABC transporter permease subunit [Chloroflexota bacterium]